ncbi:hypothetical protein [Noviherbaspirillum sedimenti]|uniref:Uncharacterized protein n=1 Tax=Noviherbaspirillum sedimenti TaxID=2320865 RepID=A0A3A3G557_9BURK|nr:hypothetical protein [Noviherbaspirillum sedimenti]RJG03627.1 hypothetical protein D3878_20205 [Noviherbaspirillum sedimenti]
MYRINQPSKQEVRAWLLQRRAVSRPPPDVEQIRRELAWSVMAEGDDGNRDPAQPRLAGN